jgi:hypothetical protein
VRIRRRWRPRTVFRSDLESLSRRPVGHRDGDVNENVAMDDLPPPQFLNITLYAEETAPLRAFYHDLLGLPIDYEEPGHIAVMGPLCAHDPSEGPVGTVRLYFIVDDPGAYAEAATHKRIEGTLRTDGFGKPAWESSDPFGNSVVLLSRS